MTTTPELDPNLMNSLATLGSTDSSGTTPQLTPKDVKRIVTFVHSEFERAKEERWKAEKQWYLNLAFYFGQQNVQFMGGASGIGRDFKLHVPPAPYYRSRPVINLIRPRLRREMAKLTSQKPSASVVPASSDDRDMYAAHAGEQIWDSTFRFKKVGSKIRRAVFWSCTTGNGFIKTYWDPNKIDESTGAPGDICFDPVTPFHLFVPDLMEEDIEDQPFVIHAAKRNRQTLERAYGMKFNKSSSGKDSLIDESLLNVMNVQKNNIDEVLVLELWAKPGATNILPQGGMITIADDQVLHLSANGWPYVDHNYPFAHIGHVQTGKFYRESTIHDLIPLQREYNRTRGQIIESKNKMAKPQLTAEIGSLDPEKVTTEPGQIIMYRPGFRPPAPLPLQGLPNYVLEEQDRIRSDMDEISGQHEVSRGQTPSGVTAATAISYLQEQDDSQLSYSYDSIEDAIEKVAHSTLCHVKQYWNTPRKIKITGADGSFDVKAFEGSDLRDNTDIRIEAGSALPTSKAAKQALIMDMMKMGFIDPQKGLEVMEIGGMNKIYESVQVDVRQAQRENLKMAQATQELLQQHEEKQILEWMQQPETQAKLQQGFIMDGPNGDMLDIEPTVEGGDPEPVTFPLIVPVNDWDNHEVHIEKHNNYRKTQAYESLPDEVKELFQEHVEQHMAMIQEQMMQQMEMQMGMGEEGGEEGGMGEEPGLEGGEPEMTPESEVPDQM